MRRSKSIKVEDCEFIAIELTVAEVADVMDLRSVSTIDLLFHDRLPGEALSRSVNIDISKLSDFTPSLIDRLMTAAEEVNPFFVGMLQRLSSLTEGRHGQKAPAEVSGME